MCIHCVVKYNLTFSIEGQDKLNSEDLDSIIQEKNNLKTTDLASRVCYHTHNG